MDVVVSMCRGKNCCPEAVFHDDGRVTVQEDGQKVVFSPDALELFLEAVAKHKTESKRG